MQAQINGHQVNLDWWTWDDGTAAFKLYVDGQLHDQMERTKFRRKWWIVGRASVGGQPLLAEARKKGLLGCIYTRLYFGGRYY